MTRAGPLIFVVVAALRQGTGCVNPKSDYDDFVARVPIPNFDASESDQSTPAIPCSTLLAGAPSGQFYGACLTSANAGDPTAAIYAVLQETVTPNADGTTGQVTMSQSYLEVHATNVSQTTGPAVAYPSLPISAACTYVLDAGTVTIPGASNIDGVDLVLSGTTYRTKLLTDDQSCAAFDATVTAPVTVDLTMGGNYCAFRRAPADGTITPFKLADFMCPGAPPQSP